MTRLRMTALVAGGVPLLVVALIVAVWAIDTSASGGEVLRNVALADRDIGGLSQADLGPILAEIGADISTVNVTIATGTAAVQTTAGDLGLTVDTGATSEAALEVGRDRSFLLRPFLWVWSFFESDDAPLVLTVDPAEVAGAIDELRELQDVPPTEPTIVHRDGGLEVVRGTPGRSIDPADLARALGRVTDIGSDDGIRIEVEPIEILPSVTDAEAEELATAVEDALGATLIVAVDGGEQRQIDRSALLPFVTTTVEDGELRLGLEPSGVNDLLADRLGELGVEAGEATVSVSAGELVYTDGEPGMRCCGPGAAADLAEVLTVGEPVTVPVQLVEVDGEDARERFATELGIVEKISEFTTEHPAGQARVTNIHRIADILRGTVIAPGETFSINDTIGRRTTEKGFVAAGVIYQGVFTDDVGGGISQFATTLFNAAFFAGLDFGEYQSHSIYISRYPYGREATLSYPHPDLQVVNNTPYGILMWPTYTDSSITVALYSTQYFEAGQIGQTESAQGVCTRVTTRRERTNIETGEVTTDSVFAVYRPQEGIACSGDPTPAATTTTVPETTTTAPPTPTTTTAPTTTTTAAGATTTAAPAAPAPPTTSAGEE